MIDNDNIIMNTEYPDITNSSEIFSENSEQQNIQTSEVISIQLDTQMSENVDNEKDVIVKPESLYLSATDSDLRIPQSVKRFVFI